MSDWLSEIEEKKRRDTAKSEAFKKRWKKQWNKEQKKLNIKNILKSKLLTYISY